MKNFTYTNCTLLEDGIFLIERMKGLPAKLFFDGTIDYYDRMQGFIEKKIGAVVDFMDCFQNKVYALDSKEDNLAIYDLNNYKCQYIQLRCSHRPWMNFVALERYGLNYYIFPKYENRLLVFDIESEKIRDKRIYFNCADEIQCVCRVKDSIWMLPKDTDNIFCYHLPSGECEVYELKKKVENCIHAFFDGVYIFFLNKYGVIYRWDVNSIELNEITVLETEHSEKESMSRIIHVGNKLILLPARGNNIKSLDLLSGKTEIYLDYPEDFFFQPDGYKFYGYCEDDEYYIFAQCVGNYYLKINKQSGQLVWIKPVIDSLGKRTIEIVRDRTVYEESIEITDLFKVDSLDKFWIENNPIGKNIFNLMKA